MKKPNDLNAEKAVLGAVLCDNAALGKVRPVLTPADFYVPAHAKIYDAMLSLFSDGQPIDHITLTDRLKARGHLSSIGGMGYLMQLDQVVPIATNAGDYASIVRDRATRRRLELIGRKLAEHAVDESKNVAELKARTTQLLASASSGHQFHTLRQLLETRIWPHLQAVQAGTKDPITPTGIRALDNAIGGLAPTFILIGARTGVGKSAIASSFVQNLSRWYASRGLGERVGVFSLEDEGEWLGWRYLSAASGVNGFLLNYRKLTDNEWERVGQASGSFAAYDEHVLVCDEPNLTSGEIVERSADMILNYNCRAIVADHMQEIDHWSHGRGNLEQNMVASSADLRGISKTFGIPFVLFSQLLENKDTKPDQKVTISDFYGARDVVKKSRVCLGARRAFDSDKLTFDVLKQTKGIAGREVEVEFINGAAMIRDIEGADRELEIHRTAAAEVRPRLTAIQGGLELEENEKEND